MRPQDAGEGWGGGDTPPILISAVGYHRIKFLLVFLRVHRVHRGSN